MKKLILALILSASFFNVKATNFSLVIATTDSSYAHWKLSTTAVATDNAAIVSLGVRPTPPAYDSTNGNHSTWATSAATWDSSSNSLQTILAADIVTNRTNELTLLASIGYGSAFANTPVNQWIMVQGNNFTTVWIGYEINTNYIVVLTTRPTQAFPRH